KLSPNVILVCGGRTKGLDYKVFAEKIRDKVKHTVVIKSELTAPLVKLLPEDSYSEASDLKEGINSAFQKAKMGDKIVVSPAAAFFYTDFIKGKKSIKRLVEELSELQRDPETSSG
ncbi:hypothetical protein HY945_04770, partial [Candidatus Gottesmanbacteria bacterium]|nr:hypothetical protein [Candidatus Gottesmanbacteria bacterium]